MKGDGGRKSGLSRALTPHDRQGWSWWTHERHRQQKRQPRSPINTDCLREVPPELLLPDWCNPNHSLWSRNCQSIMYTLQEKVGERVFMLVLQWGSCPKLAGDTPRRTPACWGSVRLFSPHRFVMMYRQRASCGLSNLKMGQEKERAPKCWKKGPFCAQGTASNTGNEHKFAVSCPASESAVPPLSLPPPPPHSQL